jgi:hypothetical protein
MVNKVGDGAGAVSLRSALSEIRMPSVERGDSYRPSSRWKATLSYRWFLLLRVELMRTEQVISSRTRRTDGVAAERTRAPTGQRVLPAV